jgi:hypothetical protein
VNPTWADYVALAFALVVIAGAVVVMVAAVCSRRRAKPPITLGRK